MKGRYVKPDSGVCTYSPEEGILVASNEDLPVVPVAPFFFRQDGFGQDDSDWID